MKIVHGSIIEIQADKTPTGKFKVINNNLNNDLVKDSNVGGPLLLTDIDQDSFDNSNSIMGQTTSKQFELNTFADNGNLLESEHLSLNVDSILLTDNVKELEHFNFELNESETEQLVCDLCLKSFKKLRLLIIHLAQHTGKFTCLECNKVRKPWILLVRLISYSFKRVILLTIPRFYLLLEPFRFF